MIETKIDRVPIELIKSRNLIKKKFNLKTHKEAYTLIARVGMTIPDTFDGIFNQKKKKANFLDIVTFGLFFIVFLISLAVGMYTMKTINTAMQSALNPVDDARVLSELNQTVNNSQNWWDFAFALGFFGMMVIILALNMLLGTDPFYLWINITLLLVASTLFTAFHNLAQSVMNAFPTVFSETSMPFTYFIMSKFYYILVVFFIVGILTLFLKPTSLGGNQNAV